MSSILGSAISGVTRGETAASVAATDLSRISTPSKGDPDVATDFVTLSLSRTEVAVGSKLALTAQQDDKALLDIIA